MGCTNRSIVDVLFGSIHMADVVPNAGVQLDLQPLPMLALVP